MYSDYELIELYCALNRRIVSESFYNYNIGNEKISIIETFIDRIQEIEKSINIKILLSEHIKNFVYKDNSSYYISFEIERNDMNLIKMGYIIQQFHLYLRTINIGSFLINDINYHANTDNNIILLLAIGIDNKTKIINWNDIREKVFNNILCEHLFGEYTLLYPSYILTLTKNNYFFRLDNHRISQQIDYYAPKKSNDITYVDIGISLFNLYLSTKIIGCFIQFLYDADEVNDDNWQYIISIKTDYKNTKQKLIYVNREKNSYLTMSNYFFSRGIVMEISKELVNELKKEIIELGNEYLDIGIGCFLEETQFENIPVVSTCTKIYKIAKDIKSAFFYKKVMHFLIYMKTIDYYDRIKFLSHYIEDSNLSEQEIGEQILLIIDKIDELEKVKYYVNFIRMYALREEVDYKIFIRLCYILEKIFIGDLDSFKTMDMNALKRGGIWHDGVLTMSLSNLGLVMWDVKMSGMFHGDDGLRITKIGELFYEGIVWDNFK